MHSLFCFWKEGLQTAVSMLAQKPEAWKLHCFSGVNVYKNMTGRSYPTRTGCNPEDLTTDRISNLPSNVIDIILGKLPIDDAVRTSVLARDWRYRWLSLTEFVFESNPFSETPIHQELNWDMVASLINNYLHNHSASIRKFALRSYCADHYSDVYQWIHFLSKQDIQIFMLDELGDELFTTPSHLFSFEKLKVLRLGNCTLQVPSTFGKFDFLSELLLRYITTTDETLECLIIGCRALERLTLLSIRGVKHLKINSPKVKSLLIDYAFEEISIENAQHLAVCSIVTAFIEPDERIFIKWRSYIRCLAGLPSLANLAISGGLVKILAADYGIEGCPLRNDHLTTLYLHNLRFETVEVFRVCLAILTSCPNIKKFGFTVEAAKGARLISGFLLANRGRVSFPQLKVLEMTYCCGMGSALDLMEFVSSHAPKLRKITIMKEGSVYLPSARIHAICSRLRKCCPQALIQFMSHGPNNVI